MSSFRIVDDFAYTFVVPSISMNCWALGFLLKSSNALNTKKINLLVLLSGIFLNVFLNCWAFNLKVLIDGLIFGLSSIGINKFFENKGE